MDWSEEPYSLPSPSPPLNITSSTAVSTSTTITSRNRIDMQRNENETTLNGTSLVSNNGKPLVSPCIMPPAVYLTRTMSSTMDTRDIMATSLATIAMMDNDTNKALATRQKEELVDSGRESLLDNGSDEVLLPTIPGSLEGVGTLGTCSTPSHHHQQLINRLRSDGFITSDTVYQAMLSVDFANFGWSYSYSDSTYIASELEATAKYIKPGDHVLVISSWYYLYVPLCIALMVGPQGQVVAHGDEGQEFIRKAHASILDTKRLVLVAYDWDTFKTSGFSLKAPYDLVLINEKYFSAEVKEQVRSPGGLAFDQVNNKIVHCAGAVGGGATAASGDKIGQ